MHELFGFVYVFNVIMIYVMFHVAMILFDRFIVVGSVAVFLGYTANVIFWWFILQYKGKKDVLIFILANNASFQQTQRHIMLWGVSAHQNFCLFEGLIPRACLMFLFLQWGRVNLCQCTAAFTCTFKVQKCSGRIWKCCVCVSSKF